MIAVGVAVGSKVIGLSMGIYNQGLGPAEKLREVIVLADILFGSVTAALAFDGLVRKAGIGRG